MASEYAGSPPGAGTRSGDDAANARCATSRTRTCPLTSSRSEFRAQSWSSLFATRATAASMPTPNRRSTPQPPRRTAPPPRRDSFHRRNNPRFRSPLGLGGVSVSPSLGPNWVPVCESPPCFPLLSYSKTFHQAWPPSTPALLREPAPAVGMTRRMHAALRPGREHAR